MESVGADRGGRIVWTVRGGGGRAGIGLTGLVLMVCGGLPLCLGLGLFGGRAADRTPADAPAARLLARDPDLWSVVAALATGVSLIGLLWLCSVIKGMLRRRRAAVDGATRMAARATRRDLEETIRQVPGVHGVKTRLTGSLARPRLVLDMVCAEDADLVSIRTRVAAEPLTRYRTSMVMPQLTAVIRFRLSARGAPVPEPAEQPEPPEQAEPPGSFERSVGR